MCSDEPYEEASLIDICRYWIIRPQLQSGVPRTNRGRRDGGKRQRPGVCMSMLHLSSKQRK